MGTTDRRSFLAAATAFLAWLFQARVNLRAFGVRRLRFARVWSVAGFLVPVLNLVRPYQVVQEVWQASDPASADAFNWKSLRVPQLLRVWWIAALGCAGLQLLAFLVGLGAGTSLSRLQLAVGLHLAANLAVGAAAVLTCFVVKSVSEAQEEKWEQSRPVPAPTTRTSG